MTKQNMPRLTESQLFTIEALNRIEGFVWPKNANHAFMNHEHRFVSFSSGACSVPGADGICQYHGIYAGDISVGAYHPDWSNSLITREQFDGVDGWVRNSGTQPVSDECIVECKVNGPLGAIGCLPASVWNWERGGLTHWRYCKRSSSEINETSAITDPAPYFARRSFSWVGCENGFITPDRIKEAELTILDEPIIVVLAEVDEDLQDQGGSKFRAAHINQEQVICNNTNQNITAHVIRYLPIDARETNQ
ncbi:hypothetical protein OQ486_09140 [Plesiomonas shigelloides]|uniref:hypothetical protein n=1 Tax=Plesiomonas shigelloides TaxID=703 RepID=UPI002247D3F3|nr:hypothetical protein [Plesiomonas shigelloides]MCX2533640.1 hypothetical protein [Plesiomonas shigelloides]